LRWRSDIEANVYLFVDESLDPKFELRIMPVDLPGGSMVYCVRHSVLPRLKTGAGVAFFFPLLNEFSKPLI
jgi:hypothetical protein